MNCAELIFGAGCEETKAVLLPGWASDHRLLEACRFGAAYACARSFVPARYMESLERFAEAKRRITLVGWSLGGFAAVDLAARRSDLIERLVLVGLRRCYPAALLDELEQRLVEDRRGGLSEFYAGCFSADQGVQREAFEAGLMRAYLDEFSLEELVEGLAYLRGREIDPAAFPDCPVVFVHGTRDTVAPFAEAKALARGVAGGRLEAVRGVGHAVFPVGLIRGLVEGDARVSGPAR